LDVVWEQVNKVQQQVDVVQKEVLSHRYTKHLHLTTFYFCSLLKKNTLKHYNLSSYPNNIKKMSKRNIIILLSLITLSVICVHQTLRIVNRMTTIDYLEELSESFNKDIRTNQKIYLVANNDSDDLHFMAQFAFVPNILVKRKYSEIPKDSLILYINDLNHKDSSLIFDGQTPDTCLLNSQANSFYKIDLIKKKQ